MRKLGQGYLALLSCARRRAVVTMTLAVLALAAAGWAATRIGTEFMPHLGRVIQVVGLLLLTERLPAVARKGEQQGNDQPWHSTVFP